ncbi:SDR family NAD(P)-dependent oxidoreductase [Mycetocola sp.]|uniref:SDR family NAD(P)-dependent oxidoreductase n=1 Tax=Mycetocola sp. TaxID=1871042 RepID=UPI0039897057
MTGRFEGRRVVVVGSGFGIDGVEDIGRASAVAFAAEGAEVAIIQVSQESADECVNQITDAGGIVRSFVNDPRDLTQIQRIADEIAADWTSIDVLVTHHFATVYGGIDNTTVEAFEETVRVNLSGAFVATKAFLPALRASSFHAAIVHAGSIDGTLGNPNIPAYSASKGGVHALIHCLAGELAAEGIRVNGIARAGSSAMPLPEEALRELDHATPLRPVGDPDEYAAAILFLASDAASYVTGAILPVDGGRTAVTPAVSPRYAGYDS